MKWLGLDIGGANLKWSDGRGAAGSRYFPLWQRPSELGDALAAIVGENADANAIAATMTGELADCYATKREGVQSIVAALESAAGGLPVWVYTTGGAFLGLREAVDHPYLVAASNWHAIARLAARVASEDSIMLLDIGSTTTDIIPIADGQPIARGRTDPERLASGELVYTGVTRSPVCSLVDSLPWRGQRCGVARELFATSKDAYLILGEIAERPDQTDTADGRPATREFAADRLARMVCGDRELVGEADIHAMAEWIREAQIQEILSAIKRVLRELPRPVRSMVVSGEGEFLARHVVTRLDPTVEVVSLAMRLGATVSSAAAAHAVAVLAAEDLG